MSDYVFKNAKGEEFKISGPAGFTFDQAKAIFDQQNNTGSLLGLDIGKGLSAATQAASGLLAAVPSLSQTLAKAGLPGGINLNTITQTLGPNALAAASQVQSSLTGQGAALGTNIIGGDANAALAAVRSAGKTIGLPNVDSVLATGTAILGTANKVGSVASSAINKIKSTLSSPVTNGINVGDMVTQGPVASVPGLSSGVTQAAMAQVNKLVGQTASQISNTLGVGKFGLGINQLETSGYVKAGTSTKYGDADLTSVLKSPTVWTGKDGVKGVTDVLSNDNLQNKIQGGLMTTGLAALKTQGIPVDSLNPQAIAGLANNAAKSVTDTLDILKGSPQVPPDVAQQFDQLARDSAFAANLAETKVEDAVLQETQPPQVEDTVDTATVDAAGTRIVGNEKVPNVTSIFA